MKKYLLVVLMFFISFVWSFNVYGLSSKTNLEKYYENLKENFSENVYGTCTYVSTTMLLSYYDTYINDDIIPERFDKESTASINSPGVINENLSNVSLSQYYDKLRLLSETSLQARLLEISSLYNNTTLAINLNQRIQILQHYFLNDCDFMYNSDYYFLSCEGTESDIIDFIKNEIDLGYPVILDFGTFDQQGFETFSHSLVVYSYENITTKDFKFICHYGDSMAPDFNEFLVQDDGFTSLKKAFSIRFLLSHKHSNNITNQYNNNQHYSLCGCGYGYYENHDYEIDGEIGRCTSCNKQTYLNNNTEILLDPSNNSLCGTFVSIYGGNNNSTDMVVGYTRIAYLSGTSPSDSRLDYHWSSSNIGIAEVTKYGTILAKRPGTVSIKAALKTDPSQYGIITITIDYDYYGENEYIEVTTDIRENSLNGTEVTINNGQPGGLTVHSGYSRALCFKTPNVYPSINNFKWTTTNSDILTVDKYGYIYAKNVSSSTTVIVNGVCKYNSKIRITLIITILP